MKRYKAKGVKRSLSIILIFALCINNLIFVFAESSSSLNYYSSVAYNDYLKNYEASSTSTSDIIIDANNIVSKTKNVQIVDSYEGQSGKIAITTETDSIEYKVNVETKGYYNIEVEYFPVKGKSADIVREININSALPFNEARNIVFNRLYKDSGEIKYDQSGNQIMQDQEEVFTWQKKLVYDSRGFNIYPLKFYMKKGENTIKFAAISEPMAIKTIKLCNKQVSPNYNAVKPAGKPAKADPIIIQGENPTLKSSQSIIALCDRSSPTDEPVSTDKLVYNVVGGLNWQFNGQFLIYDFNVKEEGLYNIGIKALQNFNAGMASVRKIYIDDKILFNELESVKFTYNNNWFNKILGDAKPYEFYFDKGKHSIKIEAAMGDMGTILDNIQNEVTTLNTMYRSLLMIMGATPDTNRDYQFEKIIPETIKELKTRADSIKNIYNTIKNLSNMDVGSIQFMQRFYDQLMMLYKNPTKLATEFTNFQSYISALASYIMIAKQQPLTIDYISVIPANSKFSNAQPNFFDGLIYNLKLFLYSFITDHNSVTAKNTTAKKITVWSGSGRDQAQIVQNLSQTQFTKQTGITVDLKLVPMTALLPATLAGIGPDVALSIVSTDIGNFAFRGATANLSAYKDFEDIKTRFSPSALVPLTFQGNSFALPETQSFLMLFYRKDILKELNLDIPKTWEDLIVMLPVLEKKQLNFGMPVGSLSQFIMMLYQNDETLYNSSCTKTNIASKKAVDVFSFLTSFYTDYQVQQTIDFVNRFRMGTTPIGLADYTAYNQLTVFAPELNGVWGFANVPGTIDSNGKLHQDTIGATTGCIMLQKAKNKDVCWEYLKWWTSKETQVSYGRQLENVLGAAARYPTANLEALSMLPWNKADYDALVTQWKNVRGIPEIPGGYYLARNEEFAFRNVVNNLADVAESLTKAAKSINTEITLKRKEIGLPTSGEK